MSKPKYKTKDKVLYKGKCYIIHQVLSNSYHYKGFKYNLTAKPQWYVFTAIPDHHLVKEEELIPYTKTARVLYEQN